MSLDRGTSIIGGLITVALVTVVVSNKNTAGIISSGGKALAGLFRAAMGK